jgi:purine-binding chemotaxis protein CheW
MNELARDDTAVRLFCSFRVQGRLYGIEAACVREVSTQVGCTPVPLSPPAVRGLTNLRSRIYLVLDIAPVLGFERTACDAASRLLVLKPQIAEDLGVLVEAGGEIIRAPEDQIERTAQTADDSGNESGGRPAPVTAGVCKLDTELMTIIDAARLVAAARDSMR